MRSRSRSRTSTVPAVEVDGRRPRGGCARRCGRSSGTRAASSGDEVVDRVDIARRPGRGCRRPSSSSTALLEHDDLEVGVAPAGLGGRAMPAASPPITSEATDHGCARYRDCQDGRRWPFGRTAGTTRPAPHPPATWSNGAGSTPTRTRPSPAPRTACSSSRGPSPTRAGRGSTAGRGGLGVRTTAKVDYAVRAAVELAKAQPTDTSRVNPVKGHDVAEAQEIPVKFLESILAELKRAGIVRSQRGAEGGYWLARPAEEVTIADIIRAVEGPLADVRGVPPGVARLRRGPRDAPAHVGGAAGQPPGRPRARHPGRPPRRQAPHGRRCAGRRPRGAGPFTD